MAAVRDSINSEGKRHDPVWAYFVVTDEFRREATCNICQASVSYRRSTSNLSKHVKYKHNINVCLNNSHVEKYYESRNAKNENDNVIMSTNLDGIWEFFKKVDEDEMICTVCGEIVIFKDSNCNNLLDHLIETHKYIIHEANETDAELSAYTKERIETRASAAWRYFTITNDAKRIAVCKFCGTECSYKYSVSNMLRHARTKHYVRPSSKSNGTRMHRSYPSKIWSLFKKLDETKRLAKCLVCNGDVSFATVSNLWRHVKKKHPERAYTNYEEQKRSDSEDEEEDKGIDAKGDVYQSEPDKSDQYIDGNYDDMSYNEDMETVYLEEFEDTVREIEKEKRKAQKRKQDFVTKQEKRNSEILAISDNEDAPSDSLRNFGSYIVSLLKELPSDVSKRLQMDFLKQIFDAQLGVEVKNSGINYN